MIQQVTFNLIFNIKNSISRWNFKYVRYIAWNEWKWNYVVIFIYKCTLWKTEINLNYVAIVFI